MCSKKKKTFHCKKCCTFRAFESLHSCWAKLVRPHSRWPSLIKAIISGWLIRILKLFVSFTFESKKIRNEWNLTWFNPNKFYLKKNILIPCLRQLSQKSKSEHGHYAYSAFCFFKPQPRLRYSVKPYSMLVFKTVHLWR